MRCPHCNRELPERQIVSLREAGRLLKRPGLRATMKWRNHKPTPVEVGGKVVGYYLDEIEAWVHDIEEAS